MQVWQRALLGMGNSGLLLSEMRDSEVERSEDSPRGARKVVPVSDRKIFKD